MPKIFQYLGYIIRFYTNDHLPIHVHVGYQGKEVKVEIHNSRRNGNFAFQEGTWKNRLLKQRQKKLLFFSEIIS